MKQNNQNQQNQTNHPIHKIEYITSSPIMRELISQIHLLANFPVDVLIYGQTGSGKDYFAKYLHHRSNREGLFIAVNCAAIPESLVETELFGVEAGAYTGAQKRMGKLEAAHQGTLYLDEIDSMPLHMQAKLLRALQERGAERIGSNRFIASNFCLIASSKIDLLQAVQQGRFREDLYHRINTAALILPALKERSEDILALFQSQAENFALDFKVQMPDLTPDIKMQLFGYDWPGNVRELITAAQRFVIGLPLFINTQSFQPSQSIENIKNIGNIGNIEGIKTPQIGDFLSTEKVHNMQRVQNIQEPQEDQKNNLNNLNNLKYFEKTLKNMQSLSDIYQTKNISSNDFSNLKNLKNLIIEYEKEIIDATLLHFKYELKSSAAFLGMPMSTLHQKIKKYQI